MVAVHGHSLVLTASFDYPFVTFFCVTEIWAKTSIWQRTKLRTRKVIDNTPRNAHWLDVRQSTVVPHKQDFEQVQSNQTPAGRSLACMRHPSSRHTGALRRKQNVAIGA